MTPNERDQLTEMQTDIKWIKAQLLKQEIDCRACPVKAEGGKNSVYRKMTWLNFAGVVGFAIKSFFTGGS